MKPGMAGKGWFMLGRFLTSLLLVLVIIALVVAGVYYFDRESATLNAEDGYGTDPKLPPPNPQIFPTVNVAEASGWPDGERPVAANGMKVAAFATNLDHPRRLLVLPRFPMRGRHCCGR